jgi:transcriptional antiterminator RfaH
MKRWYLLYCKRGEQQRAQLHLENQGVEVYYPKKEYEKILRGKRQLKVEPLFPGYMFIRFDFEVGPSFNTIRSTRGVMDFVRQGRMPTELQGELIYSLKQQEKTQLSENSEPLAIGIPQSGDKVRIIDCQFSGVDAIYHEADGDKRSILLITLINKQVKVPMDNQKFEL